MKRLEGKIAVVTGANQGIGRAIAQSLGNEGCKLALCARNVEKLAATVTEFEGAGIEVLSGRVDVSDEQGVIDFFKQVEERFGRVDILVNNAGNFDGGPIDQVTKQGWDNVIGACLTGTFLCGREAFRMMKSQGGGRILNIGSISAQRPREGNTPYAAAKFGVWGLTQAMAIDGRPHGIVCSCLHPGNVLVERRQESGLKSDDEPMMSMETIANAAIAMLTVPADVNFLEAIVLPAQQLYLGRG